jgi:hypothetical protein
MDIQDHKHNNYFLALRNEIAFKKEQQSMPKLRGRELLEDSLQQQIQEKRNFVIILKDIYYTFFIRGFEIDEKLKQTQLLVR